MDGFDKAEAGAKDGMHGVKEGSHVVVHYTVKGSEKTAREVDHIGEGGLKVMQGTAEKVDSGSEGDRRENRRRHCVSPTKLRDHTKVDAGKAVWQGNRKRRARSPRITRKPGRQESQVHFLKRSDDKIACLEGPRSLWRPIRKDGEKARHSVAPRTLFAVALSVVFPTLTRGAPG